MQKLEFQYFITDLCEYLIHKTPPPGALGAWFNDCQNIPGECLEWIKGKFKELEGFPKVLPKWLWSEYRLWLEANPDKRAKEEKRGCDKCHEGWIMVSKFNVQAGRRYDVLFRCGHCNTGPGAVPARTIYQLIEAGYCQPINSTIMGYHKSLPPVPEDEQLCEVWKGGKSRYGSEELPTTTKEVIGDMQKAGELPF